jgi:CDP-2,3-bis-(O-geranylgeranyl)-sn-glycerol synthase
LILLAVANGTPVIAKTVLGDALARPLDGGIVLGDGRPLFGSSKTIRGIVLSLLATPLVAVPMGLQWELGVLVAAAAMAGDLLSSFVKRRMGLPPSSRATGLDQIPESLFPLAASGMLVPVTLLDVVAGVIVFLVGSLVLSRILFGLRLRDRPH